MSTRDLQIALAIYTAGITRSRREYEQHPNSGVDWCVKCVNQLSENGRCKKCADAEVMRTKRANKKESSR